VRCAGVGVERGGLFDEFDGDAGFGEEEGEEQARGAGTDDDYFVEGGHCEDFGGCCRFGTSME